MKFRSITPLTKKVVRAAAETLEQRQLLATISMGELPLAYREEFAIPNGANTYNFTLKQTTTVEAILHKGNLTLKRNGAPLASGSSVSRPLPKGSYSLEITGEGGSPLLVRTSNFSPPTRLEADVWGGNAVRLNWDDNTNDEVQYRVDRWTRLGWRRSVRVPADYTAAVIDNLVPGYATTYRVSAVTADGTSLRSANIVTATTSSEDTTGLYRVTITQGMTKGEAGWDAEEDNLKIRAAFADSENDAKSKWIVASSWQSAVWTVLHTDPEPVKVKVTYDSAGRTAGDIVDHSFPSGGDFKIGTGADLAANVENFKLDSSSNIKYVVVEDSYGGIDRDYDDFYWTVDVETAEADLIAHRTGNNFGVAVDEESEESGDPDQFVVFTNNDYDESVDRLEKDYDNSQAYITGGEDDDLIKVVLAKLPDGFEGQASLTVSNFSGVRIFSDAGSVLTESDLTSTLGDTGYLSGLAEQDVTLWMEALTPDADFSIQFNVTSSLSSGAVSDEVHARLVEQRILDLNDNEIDIVEAVPLRHLLDLANGVSGVPPLPESAFFRLVIDGLPPNLITQLKMASATVPSDYYLDEDDPESESDFRSLYPTVVYLAESNEVVTESDRNLIRSQLGINIVHNQEAPVVTTTTADDATTQPAAEPGWNKKIDAGAPFDLLLFGDAAIREAQAENWINGYVTAHNSKAVTVTTVNELVAAVNARYAEVNEGQTTPRKLRLLFATHGNAPEGPVFMGEEDTDPLFRPDEVLGNYNAANVVDYRDDVLPNLPIFAIKDKIDVAVFTSCQIAESAGSQLFWNAVRQKLGISKLVAPKYTNRIAFSNIGNQWTVVLYAYSDSGGTQPLKQDTPDNDVLYTATTP